MCGMRKYLFWGLFVYIIIWIIWGLMLAYSNDSFTNVETGQIWRRTFNKDNPFQKNESHYCKVLDVQNDYVLYVDYFHRDTFNLMKPFFVYNAVLCKSCK